MMRSIAALDIDCEPGRIVPSRTVIEVQNAEHIHLLGHMRLLANTTHYEVTHLIVSSGWEGLDRNAF